MKYFEAGKNILEIWKVPSSDKYQLASRVFDPGECLNRVSGYRSVTRDGAVIIERENAISHDASWMLFRSEVVRSLTWAFSMSAHRDGRRYLSPCHLPRREHSRLSPITPSSQPWLLPG